MVRMTFVMKMMVMMMMMMMMVMMNLADYGYLSKSKLMCFLSADVVDQYLILETPTNIY